MNASAGAWEYLEAREPGWYAGMIQYVLENDGYIFQTPGMFLACVKEGEAMHVVFGYGDMEEMLRFCVDNARHYGVEKVSWSREVCGKHSDDKVYTIEQLRKRYGK